MLEFSGHDRRDPHLRGRHCCLCGPDCQQQPEAMGGFAVPGGLDHCSRAGAGELRFHDREVPEWLHVEVAARRDWMR